MVYEFFYTEITPYSPQSLLRAMSHKMQEKPDRIIASPKVREDFGATLYCLSSRDSRYTPDEFCRVIFKGVEIVENPDATEDTMEFYQGDKLLMKINRVGA